MLTFRLIPLQRHGFANFKVILQNKKSIQLSNTNKCELTSLLSSKRRLIASNRSEYIFRSSSYLAIVSWTSEKMKINNFAKNQIKFTYI